MFEQEIEELQRQIKLDTREGRMSLYDFLCSEVGRYRLSNIYLDNLWKNFEFPNLKKDVSEFYAILTLESIQLKTKFAKIQNETLTESPVEKNKYYDSGNVHRLRELVSREFLKIHADAAGAKTYQIMHPHPILWLFWVDIEKHKLWQPSKFVVLNKFGIKA